MIFDITDFFADHITASNLAILLFAVVLALIIIYTCEANVTVISLLFLVGLCFDTLCLFNLLNMGYLSIGIVLQIASAYMLFKKREDGNENP